MTQAICWIETLCLRHSSPFSSSTFLFPLNSGHRFVRKVLFAIFIIVFYSAHQELKWATCAHRKLKANLKIVEKILCSNFDVNLAYFAAERAGVDLLLT